MISTPEEICAWLTSKIRQSGRITGSDLGSAIYREFPEIDFREAYGGLKQFIQSHCSGEVVIVGKQGLDDIYALSNSEFLSGENNSSAASTRATAWQAFTNPNTRFELVVRPESGQIMTKRLEDSTPEDAVVIPKISTEDYRKMCREFLKQLDDDQRPQLEAVLVEEDFWPSWSYLINAFRPQGVYARWLRWRITAIQQLLNDRLRDIGVPDVLVLTVAQAVFRSRESHQKNSIVPARQSHVIDVPRQTVTEDLQGLAHQAIDRMSENQLRQMWLPLGSIFDAIRRNNR